MEDLTYEAFSTLYEAKKDGIDKRTRVGFDYISPEVWGTIGPCGRENIMLYLEQVTSWGITRSI